MTSFGQRLRLDLNLPHSRSLLRLLYKTCEVLKLDFQQALWLEKLPKLPKLLGYKNTKGVWKENGPSRKAICLKQKPQSFLKRSSEERGELQQLRPFKSCSTLLTPQVWEGSQMLHVVVDTGFEPQLKSNDQTNR